MANLEHVRTGVRGGHLVSRSHRVDADFQTENCKCLQHDLQFSPRVAGLECTDPLSTHTDARRYFRLAHARPLTSLASESADVLRSIYHHKCKRTATKTTVSRFANKVQVVSDR